MSLSFLSWRDAAYACLDVFHAWVAPILRILVWLTYGKAWMINFWWSESVVNRANCQPLGMWKILCLVRFMLVGIFVPYARLWCGSGDRQEVGFHSFYDLENDVTNGFWSRESQSTLHEPSIYPREMYCPLKSRTWSIFDSYSLIFDSFIA